MHAVAGVSEASAGAGVSEAGRVAKAAHVTGAAHVSKAAHMAETAHVPETAQGEGRGRSWHEGDGSGTDRKSGNAGISVLRMREDIFSSI